MVKKINDNCFWKDNISIIGDGDEAGEIDRLMCWAHVDRAVDRPEYFAAVRAEDKEVANKIMDDFNTL